MAKTGKRYIGSDRGPSGRNANSRSATSNRSAIIPNVTGKKQRSPRRPTLLSVAKQAKKAGIEVARYEIEPGGKITIVTSKGDSASVQANPWDEVLKGDGDHAP
jgi:hypothetical protein